MTFRSPTERRLWLAAAALMLAIYSTLAAMPPIVRYLRDRNLLRISVVGAFVLAGAAVAALVVRRRPGWRELAVAAAAGAVYAVILARMERAEEAFHFLEYGLFAALALGALGARRRAGPPGRALRRRWAPAAWAVALTAAAGLVDETIQGILPTRYWDLRDLGFNALAGVLAVAALTATAAARARDHGAGSAASEPTG